MSNNYYKYWGKATKLNDKLNNKLNYHLLAYHALDVAAVGEVYLQRSPKFLAWLAEKLGQTDLDATRSWVVFWLALHDIGKFSISFQSQRADLVQQLQGVLPQQRQEGVRHDTLGMAFWTGYLQPKATQEAWFGGDADFKDGAEFWARAVMGHHGQPPKEENIPHLHRHFRSTDLDAALDFVDALRVLLLSSKAAKIPSILDTETFEEVSCEVSWWVAGLAVLADWIGSNADIFKYHNTPNLTLDKYWDKALHLADKALMQSDVVQADQQSERPFCQLFPYIQSLSPLQVWAASVDIPQRPQIYLLEDVTGAGKTEAAVMLAHRMMARGCASGFFIGLPTMATANAMYGRIAGVYDQLFPHLTSLALAHARKQLVEAFAASVIVPGSDENDTQQTDETATQRCSRWLADHNKRALLASAGVGTVDQALLAALQSKHQSLRLLGLWGKVLIVDEVHACDAYMQRTLEHLLGFHAQAGGSAILLSATLTQHMKVSLLGAYAKGLGERGPVLGAIADYPLATTFVPTRGRSAAIQTPLKTLPNVSRTVSIRYEFDTSAVMEGITVALAKGQCVAWIRNTVSDAMAAYTEMATRVPAEQIILFHARFVLGDRLDIEDAVLRTFGAGSGPDDRHGRLLIATQVVEQSLDVDFDLVVTDLAPIDRLIQRAGRLHRHVRDYYGKRLTEKDAQDQRGPACLWVLGPAWTDAPTAAWFRQDFPKSAKVYPNHGHLWLTARALQSGQFTMPESARGLIEGVFGEDAVFPEGLQRNATDAEGKACGEASHANRNVAKRLLGYRRKGLEWDADTVAPSRLGEETIDVLLGQWVGNELRPWRSDKPPKHAWAYSTVRVAKRLIEQAGAESTPERALARQHLNEQLPSKGKWLVVLGLECIDDQNICTALSGKAAKSTKSTELSKPIFWVYNRQIGLHQKPEGSAG